MEESKQAKARQYKYHAFISYRHADNKVQGRQWATWLHQAIETYEVPKDLVGKKNGRGDVIPARIYPIFRDEEELPAHADLGTSIVGALEQTNLLVVLCSPRAVASTYVADEIDYFKKVGGSDRIIAAMIDGEPNTSWDTSKHSLGFTKEDECFPVPLQFEYDQDGNPTDKHAEPIAADFRINNNGKPEEGFTTPAAYREHLKATTKLDNKAIDKKVESYQQQLHLMLLKIIAGILGVPLGELTQRDKEYQLEQERLKAKKLRQWLGAVGVLALLAIGLGVIAFSQKERANLQTHIAQQNEKRAIEQRDESQLNQSRFLLDQVKQANSRGEYDLALLLGLNAIPGLYGGERQMPKSLSVLRTAIRSLDHQLTINSLYDVEEAHFLMASEQFVVINKSAVIEIYNSKTGLLEDTVDVGSKALAGVVSPDGKLLAIIHGDKQVSIYSLESRAVTHEFSMDKSHDIGFIYNRAAFSLDSNSLYVASNDQVKSWDCNSGKEKFAIDFSGAGVSYIKPNSGKSLLILHGTPSQISVLDLNTGAEKKRLNGPEGYLFGTSKPFVTKDDKLVIFYDSNGTHVYDLEKESVKKEDNVHLIKHAKSDFVLMRSAFAAPKGTAEEQEFAYGLRKTPLLFNLKTKKSLQLPHFSEVSFAEFTPSGEYVVTLSVSTVSIWHVETAQKVNTIQLPLSFSKLKISDDGNYLLAYEQNGRKIGVWGLAQDSGSAAIAHAFNEYLARFSPIGRYLIMPDIDGTLTTGLYDIRQRKLSYKLTETCSKNPIVKFSNDESKLFVHCRETDSVSVLQGSSGKELFNLEVEDKYYFDMARMSHNGEYLISSASSWEDKLIFVKHIGSDAEAVKINLEEYRSPWDILFSETGNLAAIKYSNKDIVFINLVTGEVIQKYKTDSPFTKFSFGLRDETFYLHHTDQTTKQYSLSDFTLVRNLDTQGKLEKILLVPSKSLLVTIGERENIKLWDAEAGTITHKIVFDRADSKLFKLSTNEDYLFFNGSRPAVISLDSGTIFFSSDDYNEKRMFFDVESDQILTLKGYVLKIVPALTKDVEATAIGKLSPSRRCLTSDERTRYYLPKLSEEMKVNRGCS